MTNLQHTNDLTWVVAFLFFNTFPGVILYLSHLFRNNHEELEDVQLHAKEELEIMLSIYLDKVKSYLDSVFSRASREDLARLKEEIDNFANLVQASLDSYHTLEANLHVATGGEMDYFHLLLMEVFDNTSAYYENVLSMGVYT